MKASSYILHSMQQIRIAFSNGNLMVNKISDDDRGTGMVFSQSEFKNLLDTDFADGTDFFLFFT